MRMTDLRPWLLLLACLAAPVEAARACADDSRPLLELRVTSDRGEGFDRVHRIRVSVDGCVSVRRPPFHRAPGEFIARLDEAGLAGLRARAADPVLRAIDPVQALDEARAAMEAHALAEGALMRTHVSHPTGYVLRLWQDDEVVEIKAESIFQQAELHPRSAELERLAEAIREVLALDALPELTPADSTGASR